MGAAAAEISLDPNSNLKVSKLTKPGETNLYDSNIFHLNTGDRKTTEPIKKHTLVLNGANGSP